MQVLWKDEYSIGLSYIDTQHKELFSRAAALFSALDSDEAWEAKKARVQETREFLKEYVIKHFQDEEEYQRSVGYPGLKEHTRMHNGMLIYIYNFDTAYEQDEDNEALVRQFAQKLLDWLVHHISVQDRKIGEYVKSSSKNG
ncbi:MAG TPA: hemerythrin family protein [Candidatus Atribacteria bacterium]|nr:hemerythrin family protein [Candidatus Atribacteria bacterium]HPT78909.1 hemerythrin family protein [Candidatus Atribacteria bacterium]